MLITLISFTRGGKIPKAPATLEAQGDLMSSVCSVRTAMSAAL